MPDGAHNGEGTPPSTRLTPGPSTNFQSTVLNTLSRMTAQTGAIDQEKLRQCIGLSSSYLLTDTAMNPEAGFNTWSRGLNVLVDTMIALHARDDLELETVSQASKACSECWTVASNWRGLEEGKDTVRNIANKLKKVLDPNGRTYKGEPVYAP